jgi:hypothetical protein
MKPDWEELPRGDVHWNAVGYHATINPKGHIALNGYTLQKMDEPEAVNILFDRVNNRIGLRPAERTARNAYRLHPRSNKGSRVVHAGRLLAEYNIDLPETHEFRGVRIDDDGVLILDLRTARTSNRALAWQQRRVREEVRPDKMRIERSSA